MTEEKEKMLEFLKKVQALGAEYNYSLSACGCCEGINLFSKGEDDNGHMQNIKFDQHSLECEFVDEEDNVTRESLTF